MVNTCIHNNYQVNPKKGKKLRQNNLLAVYKRGKAQSFLIYIKKRNMLVISFLVISGNLQNTYRSFMSSAKMLNTLKICCYILVGLQFQRFP